MRCLGKTFNSKEGDDSRDGGVKLVGARSNELGLDAHSVVELTTHQVLSPWIPTRRHIRPLVLSPYLCTCSADLSFCSELGGVGLEEVDAFVGLNGIDTLLSTCFPNLNV